MLRIVGFDDEYDGPPPPAAATADSIRERLDDLGWNQFDLVRESGVSATTIRWLQTGVQRTYRPTSLAKVSKALGWPAGALRQMLEGKQAPEPISDPRVDNVEPTSEPTLGERIRTLEELVSKMEQAMRARGILQDDPPAQ